jgi:hypothetical protein
MLVVLILVCSSFGQDSNLSGTAGDYGNSLTRLLHTLTEAATCKEALKPKDEFETTAQYQQRFQLYAQRAESLLQDTIAAFNRQSSRLVFVWFSFDQGQYDADAGVYILKPSDLMEYYDGINVTTDKTFFRETRRADRWFKPALELTPIRIKADPTLARKLRSHERAMRAVLFFRLNAYTQQAETPRYLASERDIWRYRYSIRLVLRPYRLEVRDSAETRPVIFSSEITPDEVNGRDLG